MAKKLISSETIKSIVMNEIDCIYIGSQTKDETAEYICRRIIQAIKIGRMTSEELEDAARKDVAYKWLGDGSKDAFIAGVITGYGLTIKDE